MKNLKNKFKHTIMQTNEIIKGLREELDRCFKDTSLILEVNVKLRREMRMLEKLLELNMKDRHNLAEQRDWYYERYTHYKKTTSS